MNHATARSWCARRRARRLRSAATPCASPSAPTAPVSPDDRVILRREDGNRDYWDREP